MKDKVEISNFENIINLFRKIIASVACIEKITNDEYIRQTSIKYLEDFINQYDNYQLHKDINKISFKFSEKEIIDFSNECYDKVDIILFAEDLEFGFSELIKKILEERRIKNV